MSSYIALDNKANVCYNIDRMDRKRLNDLRNKGLTFQQIGNLLGVSRQRAHQIISNYKPKQKPYPGGERTLSLKLAQKRYYERNKDKFRMCSKNYQRKHRLMVSGKSVSVNKRPRPNDICELCGRIATKLNYHHWNDSKPILGMWLCGNCHFFAGGVEKGGNINNYLKLKGAIENDN